MSKLASALLAFQKEAPSLHRDSTNPHFRNKYISLEGLVSEVLPVLNKQGLTVLQFPTTVEGQPALRTKLLHAESGEFEEDTMPLVLQKQDPQGQGSAITYARRYSLMAILGLVADEDDDGNAASRPKVDGATGRANTDETRSPAGAATQPPAPSQFNPPPAVQEQLAAKQGSSVPNQDGGVPEEVVITFGKHKGSKLGDLVDRESGYVKWLAGESFEPKSKEQRRVKGAAQTLLGMELTFHGEPEPAAAGGSYSDDIPFQRTI